MTKSYLIFIFAFLGFLSNAQDLTLDQVDSLTNDRIQQLLEIQDSVLLYESGCVGCYFISDDDCNCRQVNYLISMDPGNCMIQKIDCCGVREAELFDRAIWEYFKYNDQKIFNSQFKVEYSINHYFFDYLSLQTSDSAMSVKIRNYYFDAEVADSITNMNQPAKIFIDKLIKSISEWEKKH